MRRLLLMSALSMPGTLFFATMASAQSASSSASAYAEDGGAITARGADTMPPNPDGTRLEGYVTVNAPFYAEESPDTPDRVFGHREGNLASCTARPAASVSAQRPCGGSPTRVTPNGIQCSELSDLISGSPSTGATASASVSAIAPVGFALASLPTMPRVGKC